MKIQMLDEFYANDFTDSMEGYSKKFYLKSIANQKGIATDKYTNHATDPDDKWYDIELDNGEQLKCIHESWFKKLR